MWSVGSFSDEFQVGARLYMKLDIAPSRESLLHFLEQIRRSFPELTRFRQREEGGVILDEEGGDGAPRRHLRIDAESLRIGYANPPEREALQRFGERILEQAPPHLSLSDLDYDHMDVLFAFDFEYAGNHDALVADALQPEHPFTNALALPDAKVIDCQPVIGVALTDDCATQAFLELKSRTSTFEVRTGEFEPNMISVYLTLRRYWGLGQPRELTAVFRELLSTGERIATTHVVPHVVRPLGEAIGSRR